jgi:hypothetical protein
LQRLDLWIRRQKNFTVHYFDHIDVVSDPAGTASEINRFLGLPLDTEAMIQSVVPSLHRNHSVAV